MPEHLKHCENKQQQMFDSSPNLVVDRDRAPVRNPGLQQLRRGAGLETPGPRPGGAPGLGPVPGSSRARNCGTRPFSEGGVRE